MSYVNVHVPWCFGDQVSKEQCIGECKYLKQCAEVAFINTGKDGVQVKNENQSKSGKRN